MKNNCPNCGHPLEPADRYCSNCGQATFHEDDIRSFVQHFLSDYFTFDSKIFRSIWPLFSKPGFLTIEYLKGKRASYITPLRLFIFTSIIFFLLLSLLDQSEGKEFMDSEELFWDNFFESLLPKLFFLLSPIFALILALFFKKRNNSMLVHFLFSLHFHATLFSSGIIYVILSWLIYLLDLQFLNQILLSIFGLFLLSYLWRALRNVYSEGVWGTSWRYLLLAIIYLILIVVSTMALAVVGG